MIQTHNDYLSFAVEAQDLKADAGGTSSLDLVQVSEKVKSGSAPAVVQLPLRQNTKQSRLPRVHITQHSHTQVQELLAVQKTHNREQGCVFRVCAAGVIFNAGSASDWCCFIKLNKTLLLMISDYFTVELKTPTPATKSTHTNSGALLNAAAPTVRNMHQV